MTAERFVMIRAKPFACYAIGDYECMVSLDGTVRVWDRIAGHYTTCHNLSEYAQQRARKLAREQEGAEM